MSDSSNTFENLLPAMKNKYGEKIERLVEKPNSSKQYFGFLKRKLNAAKKLKKRLTT